MVGANGHFHRGSAAYSITGLSMACTSAGLKKRKNVSKG